MSIIQRHSMGFSKGHPAPFQPRLSPNGVPRQLWGTWAPILIQP